MQPEITTADRSALQQIVAQLEAAWNAMDGNAFAAPFADDADFVNIRGEQVRGRNAIAAGHAAIFRTIYAGSTIRCRIESMRLLRSDVALVHVQSQMEAPHGPLAGRRSARFSMVLTKELEPWHIAAFHNTLEAS